MAALVTAQLVETNGGEEMIDGLVRCSCMHCGAQTEGVYIPGSLVSCSICSMLRPYDPPNGELSTPQQRQLTRLDVFLIVVIGSALGFILGVIVMAEVML